MYIQGLPWLKPCYAKVQKKASLQRTEERPSHDMAYIAISRFL